jgi:tetratricopeptide (TPR) repeat protein
MVFRAKHAAAAFALVLAPVISGLAQTPWYVSYEDAVTAQSRNDWSRSVPLLKEALKEKSGEKLKAKTYGLRFVNYLPYYALGTAYYHLQDKGRALACFDSSLSQKAILDAPDELSRLQSMRTDLLGPARVNPPPATARRGSEDSSAAITVPPAAGVPPGAAAVDDAGPGGSSAGQLWYVNYETGLAYIESGDWLKAAENLKLALGTNALPHRYARTYGMWFIRYMPYYYLGLAYYNQGLWQQAANYFEVSRRFEETGDLDAESATLEDLLKKAKTRAGTAQVRSTPAELGEMVSSELSEGIRLFNRQEFDEAGTHFKKAERLDPYNSVAKSYLGKLAGRLDKPQPPRPGTREDFTDGVLQLLRGKPEKALACFSKAEPVMQNDASFHAYVGVAYALRHKAKGKKDAAFLTKAEAEFRRTLEIDPSYQLDGQIFSRDVISLFGRVKKGMGQ